MGNEGNQNGWNEYSRLVLEELEKLNKRVEDLSQDNNVMRQELTKAEQTKEELITIKNWKNNIDEVSSPTQLKELQQEVEKLKTFKTMSTTVWVVVQIIFTLAATIFGLYLKSS